ncbi:tetratricopeptide repeat protein [Sulfurimonas sp.]|uniref:tetratricopeptide repeat protein n=1 Tax=Sulfurimonas sp. TaxID=2022749 RepID=UPI003D12FA24
MFLHKTIKLLLSTLLILALSTHAETTKALEYSKPPYDQRLNDYPRAKSWYQMANDDSAAAYNIGFIYQDRIKDYKKAEVWYKKAWSMEHRVDVANNLGCLYDDLKEYKKAEIWYKKVIALNNNKGLFNLALLYETKLNNYTKAIKYYKLAVEQGHTEAANNLASLYKTKFHNYKEAIKWYKKAIKQEDSAGLKNLGRLYYHQLKDNINASQYYLAMIGNPYKKERIINFLKNKWKISETDIKKGYQLQLNSKIIPEKLKYKGGI